jgi:AcrR family transcriptional regulator
MTLQMADLATKDRILESALAVFAERGYDRATLSEITRRANANIAAVNYYFRSKRDLFRDVVDRFFRPLNEARIAEVEALARFHKGGVHLRPLIEAIVSPLVQLSVKQSEGRAMLRLMLQMRGLPRSDIAPIISTAFDPVHDTVVGALAAALPEFSRTELVWRYDMARGAILHTLSDPVQIDRRLGGSEKTPQLTIDMTKRLLIDFLLGGFSAPPTVDEGPRRRVDPPGD